MLNINQLIDRSNDYSDAEAKVTGSIFLLTCPTCRQPLTIQQINDNGQAFARTLCPNQHVLTLSISQSPDGACVFVTHASEYKPTPQSRLVPNHHVEQTVLRMAMAPGGCSETCSHCGGLNTFLGFTSIEAYICRHCGESVVAQKPVQ